MNTALRLPKSFDEVTEATLLDEDWYEMRLVKPPTVLPNGALKQWMKENDISAKGDKLYEVAAQAGQYQNTAGQFAGLNWVLDLRTVSADKLINGRSFRVYLGIPTAEDANRVTPMGQTVQDSKMERIKKHLEAFSGGVDGAAASAELTPGDSAMFYVVQRYSDFSARDENTIDIGSDPQPIG
jgi:hypothetical protein